MELFPRQCPWPSTTPTHPLARPVHCIAEAAANQPSFVPVRPEGHFSILLSPVCLHPSLAVSLALAVSLPVVAFLFPLSVASPKLEFPNPRASLATYLAGTNSRPLAKGAPGAACAFNPLPPRPELHRTANPPHPPDTTPAPTPIPLTTLVRVRNPR
jgi:hypothetical protein